MAKATSREINGRQVRAPTPTETSERSGKAVAGAEARGTAMPFPCEKCGGELGAVIWFNGRRYWQCVSPAREVLQALENGNGVDNELAKCGFWSTKTMKAD